MKSVKEIVLSLCAERGVKIGTLERETRMSNGTIKKWTDETLPSGATLVAIADYFGVSVDYLLGREAAGQDPDRPDSYDEIRAELDALRRNPELRVLLSASADLTQEDIAFVTAMAKRMKGEE